ncbi:unnamed protein product [Mytilus coruscus]|uniref:Uncharacterized protein n=1 Tax=Mytilus coruscus TaxID=42192 RepID=A0A6J8D6K9_MYTCO|nr:unnamed protein product [Mytilus coruscus]
MRHICTEVIVLDESPSIINPSTKISTPVSPKVEPYDPENPEKDRRKLPSQKCRDEPRLQLSCPLSNYLKTEDANRVKKIRNSREFSTEVKAIPDGYLEARNEEEKPQFNRSKINNERWRTKKDKKLLKCVLRMEKRYQVMMVKQRNMEKVFKTWKDKREYVNDLATEAEFAAYKGDIKTLYNITKTLSRRKTAKSKPVKDKDGKVLPNLNEQMERWNEYFINVLNRPEPDQPVRVEPAGDDLNIKIDNIKIIRVEDKVTMGLARIERTLLEYSQMLRRLISGQLSISAEGVLDLHDLIQTPMKTVDELAELYARFLEDGDFPRKTDIVSAITDDIIHLFLTIRGFAVTRIERNKLTKKAKSQPSSSLRQALKEKSLNC